MILLTPGQLETVSIHFQAVCERGSRGTPPLATHSHCGGNTSRDLTGGPSYSMHWMSLSPLCLLELTLAFLIDSLVVAKSQHPVGLGNSTIDQEDLRQGSS